ncbi:MAG: hypothetical protein IJG07_05585 [Prevotella sp.]|nr:hypothetical protein [Prevotella sp.]
MKAINLKPEAVELLNKMCDVDELESRIAVLDDAEEKLQDMAYQTEGDVKTGFQLYDIAYSLKTYKKELIKLKEIIGDGREYQNQPG